MAAAVAPLPSVPKPPSAGTPLTFPKKRVVGRKNYYILCVGLFTAASLLCGIVPSLQVMLIARILQGIGGGGLAPVEQAILGDTFPPEKRASAFCARPYEFLPVEEFQRDDISPRSNIRASLNS